MVFFPNQIYLYAYFSCSICLCSHCLTAEIFLREAGMGDHSLPQGLQRGSVLIHGMQKERQVCVTGWSDGKQSCFYSCSIHISAVCRDRSCLHSTGVVIWKQQSPPDPTRKKRVPNSHHILCSADCAAWLRLIAIAPLKSFGFFYEM